LISNVAWGKKKIHSCPSCMKLALKGSAVAWRHYATGSEIQENWTTFHIKELLVLNFSVGTVMGIISCCSLWNGLTTFVFCILSRVILFGPIDIGQSISVSIRKVGWAQKATHARRPYILTIVRPHLLYSSSSPVLLTKYSILHNVIASCSLGSINMFT
jgi:hypothetical protein